MKTIQTLKTSARNLKAQVAPATHSAKVVKPLTKANEAAKPKVTSEASFTDAALRKVAFYADDNVLVLNMDVREAMGHRRSTVSATTA
jgi:site-specific DNA-methyltransferase (adenine-specific)